MITERSLACVISLAYDRQIEGEDARATACHQELLRRLAEAATQLPHDQPIVRRLETEPRI